MIAPEIEIQMDIEAYGKSFPILVYAKIVERGTVYGRQYDDYMGDIREPGRYSEVTYWDESSFEIEELPSYEIIMIHAEDETGEDVKYETPEEINAFFVNNPGIKEEIEKDIDYHCETDLFNDVISSGSDTFAYHLIDS